MILTPIPPDQIEPTLRRFAEMLPAAPRAVFARLANPAMAARAAGPIRIKNDLESIDLISIFAVHIKPGPPRLDFSWNGASLRGGTEAYVLLHELAHWQLAPPSRRRLIDFGLGPGPETGDIESARRAQGVFGLEREREEAMASLLGILWEVELGHPALASFLDQNWLEGAQDPARLLQAAGHFTRVLGMLCEDGFLDAEFRPRRHWRGADRDAA